MNLIDYREAVKVELSDTTDFFSEEEIDRGVMKCISLMSRFIPKKTMVETTWRKDVNDETLTIASSTGTLAKKPVKYNSETVKDGSGNEKTRDTDYTINYLTGKIDEVGSNLPDGDYTVDYELDPIMLDISTLLPDYIRIERLEYPAGDVPANYPPFDVMQDLIILRAGKEDVKFVDRRHIRIVYWGKWTAPTTSADGDYPSHLSNVIVIGAAGQCLIFKAEKYVQSAVNALSELTPPDDYTITKPEAPTAPDAPTLDFSDAESALSEVAGTLVTALGYLSDGEPLINASTYGDRVGETYGAYGDVAARIAANYINQAIAYIREQEDALTKYANEVSSYGNEINAYRVERDIEVAEVNNFTAQVNKYTAEVTEQEMKVRSYLEIAGRYLASGQAKINEFLTAIGVKQELQPVIVSSRQPAY